jgi:predicted pyridoxine 5'-phosphate oxidase superfamily flavin-nucleotide-binding protein
MKMGKLTQEMKDLIETQRVCFVASADKNGRSNVSPKSSLYRAGLSNGVNRISPATAGFQLALPGEGGGGIKLKRTSQR